MKILQRIMPLMYLKASLLTQLNPYFEDGNEKFVTESDWTRIQETLKEKFGIANGYPVIANMLRTKENTAKHLKLNIPVKVDD